MRVTENETTVDISFEETDRRSRYIINHEEQNLSIYEWIENELMIVNIPFNEIYAVSTEAWERIFKNESLKLLG